MVREIMPNGMPVIIEALIDKDGTVDPATIRMFPLFPEPGDLFAGGEPALELRVGEPVDKDRMGLRATRNLFLRLNELLRMNNYEHKTSQENHT